MPVGPYETFDACVAAMTGRYGAVGARRVCGAMERDTKGASAVAASKAKFKVGDAVAFKGDPEARGLVSNVVVDDSKYDEPLYTVKLESRRTEQALESELKPFNKAKLDSVLKLSNVSPIVADAEQFAAGGLRSRSHVLSNESPQPAVRAGLAPGDPFKVGDVVRVLSTPAAKKYKKAYVGKTGKISSVGFDGHMVDFPGDPRVPVDRDLLERVSDGARALA